MTPTSDVERSHAEEGPPATQDQRPATARRMTTQSPENPVLDRLRGLGAPGLGRSGASGLGRSGASGLGRSGARARAIRGSGDSGLGRFGARALRGSGAPGLSRARICDAERRASLAAPREHQRVSGRPDLGRRPWITAVPREHPDELEASGSAGACHRTALTIPPEQSVGGSGRTRLRARPRSRAQGHVHLRCTRRIGGRVRHRDQSTCSPWASKRRAVEHRRQFRREA